MEKRKWIVTSAWPYVNATPHLGNMIGSVLSADVFARYVRLKGDEVVFVSGSDEHGTPVAVSAMEQNTTPEELTKINHAKIKDLFEQWQISYDNYTHTHNPVHIQFTQDFYMQIYNNGFVFTQEDEAFFCPNDQLFLPDRFIEGICPFCGSDYARGDQCDKCGKLLNPTDLKDPHCRICHQNPELRKTTHWYMDFPKVQQEIGEWVQNNSHIPANARQSSLNSIEGGLPARAITRDLTWGIPATFPGSENKSIYVWFEAVLGYNSAVKQWAEEIVGDPSKYPYFWNDPETRAVFFIGKDNIIFHLIIYPGLLIAYNKNLPESEQFVLPYNVSSTEWLMYENDKFSKSRKIGIWIDEALELAPIEYWRYNLIRNRPERQDSSFLWSTFEHDVLELNDIVGNFIHRTLSFIEKNYDSQVPQAPEEADMDDQDRHIIELIQAAPQKIGELLEDFSLKEALNEVILLAREGNVYINTKEPWKLLKTDKLSAGFTFNIAIQLVRCLGILLSPFIPNIADRILTLIGSSETLKEPIWDSAGEIKVNASQVIPHPTPLFSKLDIASLQAKVTEMHGTPLNESCNDEVGEKRVSASDQTEENNLIDYETFQKCEFRVGTILNAEAIPESKLIHMNIDVGEEEPREIVGGIGEWYTPEDLINTQVVVVVNLEPKEIHGIMSNGMVLAADAKKKGVPVLRPDKVVPNGTKIR